MEKYIHGTDRKEQNRLSRLNEILNRECLEKIHILTGMNILDVGSGLGQMTKRFAELTGPDGIALGIERSQNQLAMARKSDNLPSHLQFRKGDAYALPLKNSEWGSFDLIHCRFVLEHLTKPQEAVNQMYLAAKNRGKIVLFDDNHDTLRVTPECKGFNDLWKAYYSTFQKMGLDPFIGKNLIELLKCAGCKNIHIGQVFFGACADEGKFELYAENLIEVISFAKQDMLSFDLISEQEFDESIDNLVQWSKNPNAAIWYQVCFAEGTK